MIENVTIVDKNGNGILAEGLMFIHIKSTDIKYVFYTLNEIANGNRVKIYIAETADEEEQPKEPIDEDEWEFLKKTIISVAHKEEMPDIEHIKMTGVTFNISEPKKLAIEMQVKEALKEAQFARARSNENAQEEALFVDSSMLENKSEEVPVVGNSQSNIFENPPTPIETTPEIQNQAIDVQNTTPIPNSVAGNGLMDQSGLIGEPLMTDMLANSSLIATPVLAEAYNTEMDAFAKYELDFTTVTANLAGLPAITVPCGFVDGMPVGMQLIGKVLDEATILKAAYTFEQATDFHKVMAPLGGNK